LSVNVILGKLEMEAVLDADVVILLVEADPELDSAVCIEDFWCCTLIENPRVPLLEALIWVELRHCLRERGSIDCNLLVELAYL
jgi:hypothetical protein